MKVVITDWDLGSDEAVRRIFQRNKLDLAYASSEQPEDVVAAAHDADALLVRFAPVPREVLERLEGLRFISRLGIGAWGVDLDAAAERGVAVADCPGYCTDEAVAHTVALMLALNRRLGEARQAARSGAWASYANGHTVLPLSNMTVGLIGLGRMGEGVAAACAAMGMEVLGHDPYVHNLPGGVEAVDLETLLTDSDLVCLLCPDTAETHELINTERLAQMKPGAYLVNTARGGLVDEAALLTALESGQLAGAALDVLREEPPPADHPLLHRSDVIVTPHVAYYSDQSTHELKLHAARNVVHFLTGERVGSLLTPDFRRE